MTASICFGAALLVGSGCSSPKAPAPWTINGDWLARPEPSTSGANEAMWQDAHLRFSPDGTFKEFGGLRIAGRYEVQSRKVILTLTKMLGVDSYFMDAKMAPVKALGGNALPTTMELNITRDGKLELGRFGPLEGGATFERSSLVSIEAEVRTYSHLKDDEIETEGERLWSDITDRRSESIDPLIGMLNDKDIEVRYWAIVFLGYTHDQRAVKPLAGLLQDKGKRIPNIAARALGDLGFPDAVNPLIDALKAGRIQEYSGTQALAKIADKRAVDPLIKAMLASKRPSTYFEPLGKLGDKRALHALRKFEGVSKPADMVDLATAIARLDPSDPYPKGKVAELIRLSEGGDWMVQADAIRALLAIGDSRGKAIFIRLLGDPQFVVRRDAINALTRLRAKETLPKIKPLLMDENEQVREAAQKADRILGVPN